MARRSGIVELLLERGTVVLRWQGRHITCSTTDVRKRLVCLIFLTNTDLDFQCLQRAIEQRGERSTPAAWHYTNSCWKPSTQMYTRPEWYQAAVRYAFNELNLDSCIGARFGKGVGAINGLVGVSMSLLIYWTDATQLACYQRLGGDYIDLKGLFGSE